MIENLRKKTATFLYTSTTHKTMLLQQPFFQLATSHSSSHQTQIIGIKAQFLEQEEDRSLHKG